MGNRFKEFTRRQDALNDISSTLKRMYADDEFFSTPDALRVLTERTYEVMEHADDYENMLRSDPGVKHTAEKLEMDLDEVISDVAFVMLYSTVAKQSIIIEHLTSKLEELDE